MGSNQVGKTLMPRGWLDPAGTMANSNSNNINNIISSLGSVEEEGFQVLRWVMVDLTWVGKDPWVLVLEELVVLNREGGLTVQEDLALRDQSKPRPPVFQHQTTRRRWV